MSQYLYDPDAAEHTVNEAVAASQVDDYDPDDDEGTYPVTLRPETKADPGKILNDVLVEVKSSNAALKGAVGYVLATHATLEHLRICFTTLNADDYPSLHGASQSQLKWHAYLLRRDASAIDKTRAPFNSKCNTAMKLILKYPLTLGVISLSDIPALAEGFGKLELKTFTAAMTKAKSDAEIAQEAEDKAREKEAKAKAKADADALMKEKEDAERAKLKENGGIGVVAKRNRSAPKYFDDAAAEEAEEDEEAEERRLVKKQKVEKTKELISKIELLEQQKTVLEKNVARLEEQNARLQKDLLTLRSQVESQGDESLEGLE